MLIWLGNSHNILIKYIGISDTINSVIIFYQRFSGGIMFVDCLKSKEELVMNECIDDYEEELFYKMWEDDRL